MLKTARAGGAVAALLALGACQAPDATEDRRSAVAPTAVVEAAKTPFARPDEAPSAPTEVTDRAPAARQAGSAEAASSRFDSWGVVHDFLGARVTAGKVVSSTEAIAFTKDNHVGVTLDGGESWGFMAPGAGDILAVAGAPGGPFVVGGRAGFMAISRDGKSWSDLPRFTNDSIVGVAINATAIVAVGRGGQYIQFDKAGRTGTAGMLPDKFKAKDVVNVGGRFIAVAGNKGYASNSGLAWAKLDALPMMKVGRTIPTSRGTCKLGRVGRAKGVVCEVKGTAYGLSSAETLVDDKKTVAFTQDDGDTWSIAEAPFRGINGVLGAYGGPIFVYGNKGGLATTRDGSSWREVNVNVTKNLRHGLMEGSTAIIVGDGGAIIKSSDGGENWTVVPSPVNKSLKQIVKLDGRYIIPLGKGGIESVDGETWTEIIDLTVLDRIEAPGRPGKCEGRMPTPGQVCKLTRAVTTPLGMPSVRAFSFTGDTGLATGDSGLVAFTNDGGASWNWKAGFSLRGLQSFDLSGDRVIAVGGKSVIVSTDGGNTFREAQLPKKTGKIAATLITEAGTVYAGGSGGTILRSDGDLTRWNLLEVGPKVRAKFIGLFEVGGALYAAGSRGELYRSETSGILWSPIATGSREPIQAMTSEGETVLAATMAGRKGGNHILRSDDGGAHFYVLREVSHAGDVSRFTLSGGTLTYNDRVSKDFGGVWTMAGDNWWRGASEVGDGSGLRVVNYPSRYTRDKFFIIGKDEGDYAIVDAFISKGSYVTCGGDTGCWMINKGQVYRPL